MKRNPLFHYTAPCTSGSILRYHPDYKEDPARWIDDTGYAGVNSLAARDDAVRYYLREALKNPQWLCRIDSINTTELFVGPKRGEMLIRRHLARHYKEPMPHQALSLELQVHLGTVNLPGMWLHIKCDSHEERLLLAEHLATNGTICVDLRAAGVDERCIHNSDAEEILPTVWKIFQIDLLDRTIVHDDQYAIRRSRIGSPIHSDKHVTRQLRQLIRSLSEQATAAQAA